MNIISVYRKQAFITSSRLAARHTELHSSAHTHTYRGTLPHISSCLHCPAPLRLVQGAVSIRFLASSRPTCFFFFLISPSDLPPCLLLLPLSNCSPFQSDYAWLFGATSACRPPSVSNQSAIKIHTHRHSPHGPAYCVVHQLTCKPAFIQMYANGILTNSTAAH